MLRKIQRHNYRTNRRCIRVGTHNSLDHVGMCNLLQSFDAFLDTDTIGNHNRLHHHNNRQRTVHNERHQCYLHTSCNWKIWELTKIKNFKKKNINFFSKKMQKIIWLIQKWRKKCNSSKYVPDNGQFPYHIDCFVHCIHMARIVRWSVRNQNEKCHLITVCGDSDHQLDSDTMFRHKHLDTYRFQLRLPNYSLIPIWRLPFPKLHLIV